MSGADSLGIVVHEHFDGDDEYVVNDGGHDEDDAGYTGDAHLWDDLTKDDDTKGGSDDCHQTSSSGERVQQDRQRVVHLRVVGQQCGGCLGGW